MKTLKRRALAIAGALALLSGGAAHADLLEYSFTGADGSQRTLQPSAKYANPTGTMTFALSAGVDRKVQISILDTSGAVISSTGSELLGPNDRILVGGQEYYGTSLSLDAPPEGDYQLKAEIVSNEGTTVQSDIYSVTFDVTPPSVGEFRHDASLIATDPATGAPVIGGPYYKYSELSGISDDSPMDEVVFWTIDEQGNKGPEFRAGLSNGVATVPDNTVFAGRDEQRYSLMVRVVDRAGNATIASHDVLWDNHATPRGEPEILAVYDPITVGANKYMGRDELAGFTAYTPNMVVRTNPTKVLVRFPKQNHVTETPFGLGIPRHCNPNHCIGRDVLFTDSSFVYSLSYNNLNLDSFGSFRTKVRSSDHLSNAWVKDLYLTVDDSTPIAPVITQVRWWDDATQEWKGTNRYLGLEEKDTHFTKALVKVQPRSYRQKIRVQNSTTKVFTYAYVEPGDTEVEVEFDSLPYQYYMERNGDYYRNNMYVLSFSEGLTTMTLTDSGLKEEPVTLVSDLKWVTTDSDFSPPTMTDLVIDESTREIRVGTYDTSELVVRGTALFPNWRIKSESSTLSISSSAGVTTQLPLKREEVQNNWTRTFVYDASGLPDGRYTSLTTVLRDTFNNETVLTQPVDYLLDLVPPDITVSVANGQSIESLDEILITINDNHDDQPGITSLRLSGGPANENVQLAARAMRGGRYGLEYPVMFPSLQEGESYLLTVEATDSQGNTAQVVVDFEYKPRQVTLADGMDGKLMVPAVTQEFQRQGGGEIIQTEPLTLSDGAVVSGTYDVFATLRSDAEVPLVVNGIRIEPGQTMSVMSQHNFASSGGRINLPLRPAVAGVEGSSNLLVMTSAPNSPVLVLDVNTWVGKAKLSAEKWAVRQVIDPVSITASPEAGVVCRLTSDETAARAADPVRDPVCLLEWEQTPDEAEQVEAEAGGLKLTSLQGQAVALGEQPVSYSLYLFSGDGRKIRVGGGGDILTVSSAFGAVAYQPLGELAEVYRVIQDFDVRMKQTLGPACTLTLDALQAQDAAQNRQIGSRSNTCLFEWIEIPDGMQQDPYSESPNLFGALREKQTHMLRWRVSIFTRNGTRVTLATESHAIEAVDPPAPEIGILSEYHYADDLYMVPMAGGYLGDAIIEGELTPMDVRMSRDGEETTHETFQPGHGVSHKVFRRMVTEAADLWDETVFNIAAAYNILPEVGTEQRVRAVAVPGYDIAPQIDVDVSEALDTAPLPVTVRIGNRLMPEAAYDAATMGEWQLRLVREERFDEVVPMTDYVDAPTGEVQFNLDLSGIERAVRLVAQARLKSPIEGYERVESSQRMFLTVLRGGAIDASVEGRRLSGAAPFSTVLQLALENRADTAATGDVIWEVSADGGSSWESHQSSDRNRFRWYKTYEKGSTWYERR
ncbi:Ig-like domain-containing protein [Marinobacterium aestuariivivens]|uniref:Ig-like domain-containing protein n=1 Tax=Marinobacterium aestuariivivens TaxID=1698799 RepID=A0ABW2A9D1_9GAMM